MFSIAENEAVSWKRSKGHDVHERRVLIGGVPDGITLREGVSDHVCSVKLCAAIEVNKFAEGGGLRGRDESGCRHV